MSETVAGAAEVVRLAAFRGDHDDVLDAVREVERRPDLKVFPLPARREDLDDRLGHDRERLTRERGSWAEA